MRLLALGALLPFALAAPAPKAIPELSVSQWTQVQSSFVDGLRSLSQWSWAAAEELIDEVEAVRTDGDDTQKTIWQQLKEDPNSFSKLVRIINFEGKASKILDDKDVQITFFAPNNDALTPPKRGDDEDDDDLFAELIRNPSLTTLSAALDSDVSLMSDEDDDESDDDKRKKEILRYIAGQVLKYHGLPKAYTASELAQNSTLATALKADDGSFGGLHRRIRLEKTLVPPGLKINFYAKVLVQDKKAVNGYFHTLQLPLIPPGSIFEELFLFPDVFSTLTSAVQGVHAKKYLEWHYDKEASKPGKPKFRGTGLVTIFAPTNKAFALVPEKLKFYLFSPFGREALAKLLAYHSVPHTLLLSEVYYHEKHEHKKSAWDQVDAADAYESFDWNVADDPSFHRELEVHTALPNATLKISIDKTKLLPIEGAVKTTIKVNGEQVEVIDVPARNGASHVIGKLLVPPHKHHDHKGNDLSGEDSWENWEDWFLEWVKEDY